MRVFRVATTYSMIDYTYTAYLNAENRVPNFAQRVNLNCEKHSTEQVYRIYFNSQEKRNC